MSYNKNYWTITELNVRILKMPKERIIAAQKAAWTMTGRLVILGSKGQVYCQMHKSRYDDMTIKPGTAGLALADVLLKFNKIDQPTFSLYAAKCQKASAARKRSSAKYDLANAADILGIKLTIAQQKKAGIL